MKNTKNKLFFMLFLLGAGVISRNNLVAQTAQTTTPGQSNFNYMFSQYPNNSFMYSSNWQVPTADTMYILFDVMAGDQIDVGISNTSDTSAGSYDYDIMIGTVGNWMIMLNDQGSYSSDPNASYVDGTGNGILSATVPQSFWVTLSNNVIAVGQGRDITQAPLISWDLTKMTDSNGNLIPPLTGMTYFTFSSITDASFSNIQFGSDFSKASVPLVITPTAAHPHPKRILTGRVVNNKERFSMLAQYNKNLPMSKARALKLREQQAAKNAVKSPAPVNQSQMSLKVPVSNSSPKLGTPGAGVAVKPVMIRH